MTGVSQSHTAEETRQVTQSEIVQRGHFQGDWRGEGDGEREWHLVEGGGITDQGTQRPLPQPQPPDQVSRELSFQAQQHFRTHTIGGRAESPSPSEDRRRWDADELRRLFDASESPVSSSHPIPTADMEGPSSSSFSSSSSSSLPTPWLRPPAVPQPKVRMSLKAPPAAKPALSAIQTHSSSSSSSRPPAHSHPPPPDTPPPNPPPETHPSSSTPRAHAPAESDEEMLWTNLQGPSGQRGAQTESLERFSGSAEGESQSRRLEQLRISSGEEVRCRNTGACEPPDEETQGRLDEVGLSVPSLSAPTGPERVASGQAETFSSAIEATYLPVLDLSAQSHWAEVYRGKAGGAKDELSSANGQSVSNVPLEDASAASEVVPQIPSVLAMQTSALALTESDDQGVCRLSFFEVPANGPASSSASSGTGGRGEGTVNDPDRDRRLREASRERDTEGRVESAFSEAEAEAKGETGREDGELRRDGMESSNLNEFSSPSAFHVSSQRSHVTLRESTRLNGHEREAGRGSSLDNLLPSISAAQPEDADVDGGGLASADVLSGSSSPFLSSRTPRGDGSFRDRTQGGDDVGVTGGWAVNSLVGVGVQDGSGALPASIFAVSSRGGNASGERSEARVQGMQTVADTEGSETCAKGVGVNSI
uniref:Uncharacterized protein n=1 Tax=Chromera velia CCMP2878 TaxID=1169474 RepID=A0A0G4FKX0_9ALVE|eukprot:Cvel_411.t1-p1 / transcript=Cvel_411.t1 / gene=Cvel_411 / organism=Chromera_velia_CCMP2878 / gene_product=hypothetical protein / transcript_product=hypothetical protein / location=Cvel_scaffold13:123020-124969(-) / protein_length=650 / sequence_SO=supercontig / SO=protein_coding / is_pseudo=false